MPINGLMCRSMRPTSMESVETFFGRLNLVSIAPAFASTKYRSHNSATVSGIGLASGIRRYYSHFFYTEDVGGSSPSSRTIYLVDFAKTMSLTRARPEPVALP